MRFRGAVSDGAEADGRVLDTLEAVLDYAKVVCAPQFHAKMHVLVRVLLENFRPPSAGTNIILKFIILL